MLHIVPQPVRMTVQDNTAGFELKDGTTMTAVPFAEELTAFVKKALGKTLCPAQDAGCDITFAQDEQVMHEEGYRLLCEEGKIRICARTEAGLYYGMQTLKQILLQTKGVLPCIYIEDEPRFAYRGYMMDCGRYFFPVREIKRIIDFMALHKLNVFHWHLTEDQGWRVEIKKYPLLTQKGSRRRKTNFGVIPHGGYYTQEEVREVVAYCHAHKMRVIPEFDVPGHNVAAIACYPHLSCFDRKLEVATHWGVKRDILCAGKESTYWFVYDVLDELMELFPDKVIHIGGDEAYKTRWKLCLHCQKAIRENGLRDEDDLQMLFMSKVDAYLRQRGYSSMMWNNDTKGGTEFLDPQIAWTVYKPNINEGAVPREIARGRKMINSVNKKYYFNFPYGWVSLKDVCDDDGAFTDNDEETLGIEVSMWTEYVPNMRELEFLTFPRLGAMAENAWAKKGEATFAAFMEKTDAYYALLKTYGLRAAPMRKAMPNRLYKFTSSKWFERRPMHWEPIKTKIVDRKVEKLAKKLQEDGKA